jgi:hypothetical protein
LKFTGRDVAAAGDVVVDVVVADLEDVGCRIHKVYHVGFVVGTESVHDTSVDQGVSLVGMHPYSYPCPYRGRTGYEPADHDRHQTHTHEMHNSLGEICPYPHQFPYQHHDQHHVFVHERHLRAKYMGIVLVLVGGHMGMVLVVVGGHICMVLVVGEGYIWAWCWCWCL